MDFSDDMTNEIFEIFQVESEEIISKINDNLLKLEKDNNDKEAILSLFRDAHSLKGAARMIGLNEVQEIAHKIEDILGLAKDDKISFNSEVLNILYPAIDFLANFIKKCIEKKQQIHSEKFTEQMLKLNSIAKIADNTDIINETKIAVPKAKETNKEVFQQNIDTINRLVVSLLFCFIELEKESNAEQIEKALNISKKLLNIFTQIGIFDFKKCSEDIKVKLELTLHASGKLTIAEIEELHQIVDEIIERLNTTCENYGIPFFDYYSEVFNIEPQNIDIDIKEKENETFTEYNKIVDIDEPTNENEIPQDFVFEENFPILDNDNSTFEQENDLDKINKAFDDLDNNSCTCKEVKTIISSAINNSKNDDIKQILHNILGFLDFSIETETRLNTETFNVIKDAIDYCKKLSDNIHIEDDDIKMLLNRLSIAKQLLELNSAPKKELLPNQEKLKKLADDTEIFRSDEIKTLRVDSHKLDELISQVNELTIEKIKTKKNLAELNTIKKDSEECQKNLSRVLSFLNINEKRLLTLDNPDSAFSPIFKQLINTFTAHNKELQKIELKINNLYRSIQENDIKLDLTVNNISSMVKNIRILPFGTIFHMFGRMVRDIAQEKGKKINFEIQGSETCADKKIIEEIKSPLIHIIRNSIDHGIETPEERVKKGKPEEGNILLSVYQTTNKVIIEIKDDGNGINIAKIKEKAISKGFLTSEELANMSDEQITSLIFAPGFSTGDSVTDISGRGIGLDVVQSKITKLNGKVKVISELNKGCCTQIILPTTMSILNVFVIEANNQFFAIPIEAIQTVLRKTDNEIIHRKNKKTIIYENDSINVFSLPEILGIPDNSENKNKSTILIIENEEKRIGLSIDKLVGEQEVMLKKLSAPFYKLKNISGLTTLASGEICLILNITDISNNQNSISLPAVKKVDKIENSEYKILLVDDSITTITLEKTILSKAGYNVSLASNPIEAFKKLKEEHFNLIITDFEMPKMDGISFLKKLKSDEMYADIPAIMMSSIFDMDKRKEAIAAGACKYIIKSEFNQDTFKKTIETYLKP